MLSGQYHVPKYLSTDITDLIERMLTLKPTHRGTLDDVGQRMGEHYGPGGAPPASLHASTLSDSEMILSWCRDLIQGLDTSSVSE